MSSAFTAAPPLRRQTEKTIKQFQDSAPERGWPLAPLVVRPNIGAAATASFAYHPTLDVGKSHVIGPSFGRQLHAMTAFVVGAEDLDAVRAGFAHFAERNFLIRCHANPSLTVGI